MSDAERLLKIERFLHETRHMRPDVRAQRVDEFFTELRTAEHEALRRRVRKVAVYALGRRTHWAHAGGQINAARAVAYQSIAGDLIRVLDGEGAPAPEERHLSAADAMIGPMEPRVPCRQMETRPCVDLPGMVPFPGTPGWTPTYRATECPAGQCHRHPDREKEGTT